MSAPGVGSPAGGVSATGSSGQRGRSWESIPPPPSRSERRRRLSSSRERSQSGKQHRGGWSPSPACFSHLAHSSASSGAGERNASRRGWCLSTCGSLRELLTNEARDNFERLMLSVSKALKFLGIQGVMALFNLVLSRRNSLLLDVRSTVPSEEVARLRYADLPSSASLFPTPLLESALVKMHAALNDTFVQKTLHPLKIPRQSSKGPVKAASSSASSVDRGGTSPVVPRSQKLAQMVSSSSAP